MKNFERKDLLFSLCGLNCGLCTMQLGGYCPGCGGGAGNQGCGIARCSREHGGVEYCYLCEAYPCVRYEKADEFDSFITHRNRMADMEKARRIGPEAYQAEQREKQEILQFLLENFNDGRRKSFFALAVNLLTLQEAQAVVEDLEEKAMALPIKERASMAAALLREAASRREVDLKLRKKPQKPKAE